VESRRLNVGQAGLPYNESVSSTLQLGAAARRAFDRLAGDLKKVFAQRFVSLVASGATSSLAFVSSIDASDLQALAALSETWHRDGLDTPLLLTPDEFSRSIDAFPVEYQAAIDRHAVIAGTPPFEGMAADRNDLRRACEVQAKSHLLHLRQGWIEAHGHRAALASLVLWSVAPLRALLENVGRLQGAVDEGNAAVAAAQLTGFPADLCAALLAAEGAPASAEALVPRLPEYLAAAEQLWRTVDARGRA